MPISEEPPKNNTPRGGDPLGAMYALATLLFAGFGIVAVILTFAARNGPSVGTGGDVYIPGSASWTPPRALAVTETAGITETSPGHYLAIIEASNWQFYPAEIRIPAGSEVTFRVRSIEDYHGFSIAGTPILLGLERNASREVTQTFPVAGEFLILCSQYCGAGHGTMTGKVVVTNAESGVESHRLTPAPVDEMDH